jgi:hypothetical protein
VATGGADYWSPHCHRHVLLGWELLISLVITEVLRRLQNYEDHLAGLSQMYPEVEATLNAQD